MLVLPEILVGDPIEYESLTVFPLIGRAGSSVNYLLSDEALAAGSVTVEEIGEGGSVPELTVNNQTDGLVLFPEGEELRGAKQNRVLNTSVLVAAKSKIKIPVSCVEQGRWRILPATSHRAAVIVPRSCGTSSRKAFSNPPRQVGDTNPTRAKFGTRSVAR